MWSTELSAAQLRKIHRTLDAQLQYLIRLQERMEACKFPPQDRVYRSVRVAREHTREAVLELEELLRRHAWYPTPEPFR